MTNEPDYKLTCMEMGSHHASLEYTGTVCCSGAQALERQFDRLFGYYQYDKIGLNLESPGGELSGLQYVLRAIEHWTQRGKQVAIQSTFQCASAAAVLLSMGTWGQRAVDRQTLLLYHHARVETAAGSFDMTAQRSGQLSNALSNVDRRMLDLLIGRMIEATGGTQQLATLIVARTRYVEHNWGAIASEMSSLTHVIDVERSPKWLMEMVRWSRLETVPEKFVSQLKKYLGAIFQMERPLPLPQAFALGLIDQISGVLDITSVLSQDVLRPVEVQDLTEVQIQSANDDLSLMQQTVNAR